jgi:hypothetical protein
VKAVLTRLSYLEFGQVLVAETVANVGQEELAFRFGEQELLISFIGEIEVPVDIAAGKSKIQGCAWSDRGRRRATFSIRPAPKPFNPHPASTATRLVASMFQGSNSSTRLIG